MTSRKFLVLGLGGIGLLIFLLFRSRASVNPAKPIRDEQKDGGRIPSSVHNPRQIPSGLVGRFAPPPVANGNHEIFTGILGEHRHARLTIRDDSRNSQFMREEMWHLRELRLFALAYPKEAEEEAIVIAGDRTHEGVDRHAAFFVLARLAERGSVAVKAVLLEIASRTDDELRDLALAGLAGADLEGKHLSLYRQRAREGALGAVALLSRWADSECMAALQEIYERGKTAPAPEGVASYMAGQGMEQIRILMESPDVGKELGNVFAPNSPRRGWQWKLWALDAAKAKGLLPAILPSLKSWIDAADKRASDSGADIERADYAATTGSELYDDVLVAYAQGGGSLADTHKRRLRKFGYWGDPKERLTELLAEQK
jgi:hypothetical protein